MNNNRFEKYLIAQRESLKTDDEFFIRGYDMVILTVLMALRIEPVNDGKYTHGYIPISNDYEIQEPDARTGVKNFMAAFWGRLAMGILRISIGYDGEYNFYEKKSSSWIGISPTRIYGDDKNLGKSYQSMAWACIQLGLASILYTDRICIDNKNFYVDSNSHIVSADDGECYISVNTPDHMKERIALLKNAFGSAYEALSMTQAYLLLPERSQKFILMEDEGGSGKTSWISAFTNTWPGVAAMGFDTAALGGGSFAEGNALVPLIGKSVAFSDEAGEVNSKIFRSLAALSTGAMKTVRYGSGIAEQRFFKIKIVIASNTLDDLDSGMAAVARRKVVIPMHAVHSESWWRGAAPSWSNAACMHDEVFSHESMHAMAIDGIKTYDSMCGKFPVAVSSMTALTPRARDAMADIMDTWCWLTPDKGRFLVSINDWPDTESTRADKRKIRMEVCAIMGLHEGRGIDDDGNRVRGLIIDDPEKFHIVCARYGSCHIDNSVKKLLSNDDSKLVINWLAQHQSDPTSVLTEHGLAVAMSCAMSQGKCKSFMKKFGLTASSCSEYGVMIKKDNKSNNIFAVEVK